jgi:hypothetical protein
MEIKIGDKVRFLNSVGEGVVVGFQAKDIVLVRDSDDFEVPTHVRDLVVVPATNDYNFPTEDEKSSPKPTQETAKKEPEPEPKAAEYTFDENDETPEGERLSLYLAFTLENPRDPENCPINAYLVNCSNYYIAFNILRNGDESTILANDTVEPQTLFMLKTIERTELNDWAEIRLQALASKRKPFAPKPVIDTVIEQNPTKFYKQHCFTDNDFLDEKAIVLTIVEDDKFSHDVKIDPKVIRDAMTTPTAKPTRQPMRRKPRHNANEPIEVDLHIEKLMDNIAGMDAAAMLSYQMDKFHEVMRQHQNQRGQRIIFIHGKGEGVLRATIERELKHKYRSCRFYDASFQKYGFGATEVVIN